MQHVQILDGRHTIVSYTQFLQLQTTALKGGRDGSEVVAGERKVGEVCVSCEILRRNFAQVVEAEMKFL